MELLRLEVQVAQLLVLGAALELLLDAEVPVVAVLFNVVQLGAHIQLRVAAEAAPGVLFGTVAKVGGARNDLGDLALGHTRDHCRASYAAQGRGVPPLCV